MEIRTATKEDLPRILELGKEFGHQMLYQKDPEVMEKYLSRILVAEEILDTGGPGWVNDDNPELRGMVGFYHYIVSGDPGFEEMLRCYRQFPESLVSWACEVKFGYSEVRDRSPGELCICMQGASHREVFTEFIKYLQSKYPEIWCYCSVKSRRSDTYEALGFTFDPTDEHTFWNIHKGDYSTYRLGRWTR